MRSLRDEWLDCCILCVVWQIVVRLLYFLRNLVEWLQLIKKKITILDVVPILSWVNSNKFYFNWPSRFSEDTNNKVLTDDDGHKLTTTSQMTCFVKWANTSLATMIDNIIYHIPIRYQPLLCQTTQKVQQSNHSSVRLRIKYNNPTTPLSNYA
jgi:hypothetical protein